MTLLRFFGHPPPGYEEGELPGRLIVIEATDRTGRSTQVSMLKEWFEDQGYAVLDTGLTRSDLAGPGIQQAMGGNTLDPITLNLFYAVDFWDRLERQIFPALRAGMVVLADRYVFSLIARAAVRGVSVPWMESVYGFCLIPDKVIYLDIDIEQLLPRVLGSTGFDYWESGQDFLPARGMLESFVQYQKLLLEQFRTLATRYGFAVIDARSNIADVFNSVRAEVESVVMHAGAGPITSPSNGAPSG